MPSGGGEGMSEPAPTPRTAAFFASEPSIAECRAFAERLERQHDAARAEQDALRADRKKLVDLMNEAAASAGHDGYDESVELWRTVASHLDRFKDAAFSLGEHAMFCVHHTDAERVANTVGGNCPICNKAQICQLTADRDALTKEQDALLTELDEAAKGNA